MAVAMANEALPNAPPKGPDMTEEERERLADTPPSESPAADPSLKNISEAAIAEANAFPKGPVRSDFVSDVDIAAGSAGEGEVLLASEWWPWPWVGGAGGAGAGGEGGGLDAKFKSELDEA